MIDADGYDTYYDVPLFDEHVAADGTIFGAGLLAKVVDQLNDRFDKTGECLPIRVGCGDGRNVIGYAGPFKIGAIGSPESRSIILGTLRILKAHDELFRRHRRLSMELVSGGSPGDRRFRGLYAAMPGKPLKTTISQE